MAFPREARQSNEVNALRNCLGRKRLIVFKAFQNGRPNWNEEKFRFIAGEASLPFEGEGHASELCTENPKSDHSGDEVRPGRRVNE